MTDQPQEDYFDLARSWSVESDAREARSRRIAWRVAGAAFALAMLEAIVLIMLLPLKETETVMVLVDRTTGFVQEISPSEKSTVRADEAMIDSLLAQYVTARERFDRASVQDDYRKAALWTGGTAQRAYAAQMATTNPSSPLALYRQGERRDVQVKSVTQVRPGNALVRFDTFLTTRDGRRVPDGSWISMIDYGFTNAAMSYEDRLLNPLGLQVDRYRRDAEIPLGTLENAR